MCARSLTECYHRLSCPAPPYLLPAFRIQPRPQLRPCKSTTIAAQCQSSSSSSSSSNPEDHTCYKRDDARNQDASINVSQSNPGLPSPRCANHRPLQRPNPTTLHHSLPTFLAHAARTGLSPTSTTYIGTHYEYMVAHTLRRFGFNLTRTGGRGDAGIDLLGTWHLPGPTSLRAHPGSSTGLEVLRVLVQCKALKAKLGPNLIRELEGAFAGAPSGYRAGPGGGVVGVLVSPREATKGVREAMGRSRWPMVWVMVEAPQMNTGVEGLAEGVATVGKVRQVLWNKAARQVGLEGFDVMLRYDQPGEGDDGVGKECVLMWQGRPVPGLDRQDIGKS